MVEEEEDWYDVLEVEVGTSIQEVGKKYRKLALKHHPDRGGDVNQFQRITKAYEVLSDPKKKESYDRILREEILRRQAQTLRETQLDSRQKHMRADLLHKERQVEKRKTKLSKDQIRLNQLKQDGIQKQERMQQQRQHASSSSFVTPPDDKSSLFSRGIQQACVVKVQWSSSISHSEDTIIALFRIYGTIIQIKLKSHSAKLLFTTKKEAHDAVVGETNSNSNEWKQVLLQGHLMPETDSNESYKQQHRHRTPRNGSFFAPTTFPNDSLSSHKAYEVAVLEKLWTTSAPSSATTSS